MGVRGAGGTDIFWTVWNAVQNKKRNLQRCYHSAQTSPLNNIRLQGAVHLAREHLNLQFSTLPKRVYNAYLRELNEIRYSPVALFSYSGREFRKKGSISVLLQFAKKMRSIMGWAHVSNTQGVLPDCNLTQVYRFWHFSHYPFFSLGVSNKFKNEFNKVPNLGAQPGTHLPIFFFSLEESTPIELSPIKQKGMDLTEPKIEGSRILINLFTYKCV